MASIEVIKNSKGKNVYRVIVLINGERKSKSGFKTRREAMQHGLELEREAKDFLSKEIPDLPFAAALERYLETVSPTKKGFDFERKRINSILGLGRGERLMIADVPLRNLQPKHFAAWRDDRLLFVSGSTVNREWNLLSSICSRCVNEWGWLKSNPLSSVKRPKSNAPRSRRLREGEFEALMLATKFSMNKKPETVSEKVGAAIIFAIETAMRAGEICALVWDEIDFDRCVLSIPSENAKNGHSREVPLSTKVIELLYLIKGDEPCNGLVFGLSSEQLDPSFRRVRAVANIDDLHFHDLRREALTRLAERLDVMTLAKVSGHLDLKLLQGVYFAPNMADVAKKLG